MKRIIYIIVLLHIGLIAVAQPPYPAAPAAPGSIARMEYFIRPFGGTDPGLGNGTPLAIAPQPNINGYSETINLGALPQGFYRISLRSLDANGQWSHTNAGSPFSYIVTPVYPAAPPTANVVRLEYVIDANLPFGSGTPIPITPATDIANLNAVIDISSLAAGPHILYIRSQDDDGVWSLTNLRFFSNAPIPAYPAAPPAAGPVEQLEYFIDTDPGFGLATPATITPGTDITTSFSVNGITPGIHTFYIRSRNNPWGLTTVVPFVIGSVTPVSWLYVKGEIINGQSLLQWGTANEQNSQRFELEHGTDGQRFEKVATVAAAGNSATTRQYQAIHVAPQRGMNYYRIKQIDQDGSYRYTATVALLYKTGKGLQVSPNPATDYWVLLLDAQKPVHWQLYNSSGQLVQQRRTTAQWQHSISAQGLPAGQYRLRVSDGQQVQQLVLVKQ
jgi:hypothetical protein